MLLSTRFVLVYSSILLPVIYGVRKAMLDDLEIYLLNEKPKENKSQTNFLYGLVMMNLYACLDKKSA